MDKSMECNAAAMEDLKKLLHKKEVGALQLSREKEEKVINFDNLEIIFEIMNLMAREGEIKWKYHYDAVITKDAVYALRINTKGIFHKLIKTCKELGYAVGFHEDKHLELNRMIRYKSYCLGNFNTRFIKEGDSDKKYIITKAVFIDIAKLQNMGVNFGDLLVDN